MSNKNILTLRKICVSAGDNRQILHLEPDPAIEISSGAITAIIGRSGCGKTTLLKHFALLANQSSHLNITYLSEKDNYIYGKELFDSPARFQLMKNDFSYVFQDYNQNLFEYLNVYDNFTLKLRIQNKKREENTEILEYFFPEESKKIESLKRKYPEQLSGGEKQRLAIAQALCSKPRVLFADEPTSANDVTRSEIIFQRFQQVAKDFGTAIVFISHDLHLVQCYANKVIILSPDGKLKHCVDLDEQKRLGMPDDYLHAEIK